MKTADEQTTEMGKQLSHAVSDGRCKVSDDRQKENYRGQIKSGPRSKKCGLCGGGYLHQGKYHPQGKECLSCGKMNRFSKVCRSKPNRNRSRFARLKKSSKNKHHARSADVGGSSDNETSALTSADSDNGEEYTFHTISQEPQPTQPIFQVKILETPIRVLAASGATVNALSFKDFDILTQTPQLSATRTKVYPYMTAKPLDLYGKFKAKITSDYGLSEETFYVAKGSSNSILSWMTSQKLNLIRVINTVDQLSAAPPPNAPDFLENYPGQTRGMCEYKGEPVQIYIDESVKPLAQLYRRIPFHVRKQVEEKLKQLEEDDIIERAKAEIFQKKVSDAICGIPGVKNISDDIYVGGVDQDDHDRRIKQGMSPDPRKVDALQHVAPPTNISEVRSFLSSAAFCSRFIKEFAVITRPLRLLTCEGVKWQWTEEEQSSFERLKAALSTKTTLAYFDPGKPTSIFVDGSPIGVGAVLTQKDESTN
ncbi:Pol polyprotein [Stylophora pistillata]|uniref:Pol polyprotein n=1 Tax=Stylophora pistillata TaxID=50429 RepID=A0A2B4R888_STYPI|nr:Pol polyprotein [Stylophora pistillata]